MALAKCAHPGCSCLPATEDHEQYCSNHCAEVAHHDLPEDKGCMCGHPGCDPRAIHDQSVRKTITSDTAPRH